MLGHSRIPDLPGDVVAPEHADYLKRIVAGLCQIETLKFPGSQPVSFSQADLIRLENEDYWVCEKSDGIRVLLFVQTDMQTKEQSIFLIDRNNHYRLLNGFYFPHYEDPRSPLRNTIVDGELVLDVDPQTKQDTLRFLAFDCLIVDDQNVMSRPLDKRYGRLKGWFYHPYMKMTQDHPHVLQSQPFDIKVKEMEFSYGAEKVFNFDIPRLQHGNDGLIYTCTQSAYTVGTDPKILKWKAPSENSIDFKLVLRFPPDQSSPGKADYYAKPLFGLHIYMGDTRGQARYEPYDEMHVDDDEWESLKISGEQIDDRIVEVHWEPSTMRWRMMRFRDDKPNGNHHSVVNNIIQSIMDGVEKEDLLAHTNAIRTAWKARAGQQGPPSKNAGSNQFNQLQPAQAPLFKALPGGGELHYGPLQQSPFSKVGGPTEVFGFKR